MCTRSALRSAHTFTGASGSPYSAALVRSARTARIIRAVRALLTNAALYGDPEAPVKVCAERKADRVHIVISGGGPGPDADGAAHLFEPFYRGQSAAEAGLSGSGL